MTTAMKGDLTCRQLVELVTDYLEDRMALEERVRFETHLHLCPQCRVYFRQLQSTLQVAGKLRASDVPESAERALLSAFRGWRRGVR